jgi:hypothetical protein
MRLVGEKQAQKPALAVTVPASGYTENKQRRRIVSSFLKNPQENQIYLTFL